MNWRTLNVEKESGGPAFPGRRRLCSRRAGWPGTGPHTGNPGGADSPAHHRAFLVAFLAAIVAAAAPAQRLNPVHWEMSVDPAPVAPGGRVLAHVTAKLDPGWHLYALAVPEPIIPTSIRLTPNPAVESARLWQPAAHVAFDQSFQANVGTYERAVTFLLELQLAKNAPAGAANIEVATRWQSCNNKMCLPPRRASVAGVINVRPGAAEVAAAVPAGYTLFDPKAPPPAAPAAAGAPASAGAANEGLLAFMLVAFGFGLAALLTPCVFPMIPITVSYFLKKPETTRARGVADALLFSLGIVVLFSALGLIVKAILGPFGVVQLGSNVWVNGFVALVFFIFGLSLLGAFELTLPSSVLTRLDRASQGGGVFGTLLMGLTFSLTAFACVGPFVGTLLAASVTSGGIRPLAGMVSFAAGLATPFFFLALFPSYLRRLPKSGGWMERVKVVMGFLILAAMFKYLASVDQVMQWHVLTRERFLAAWIVLFALAGLYLLQIVRLHGSKPDETVGLPGLLVGAALLALAISLVPGMFGGRLGELDAYVPPASEAALAPASGGGVTWMKNDFRAALDRARAENKLVLVSFSGYACTNCHWMQANMFSRPEITAVLKNFVLVELYTDGTDAASEQNQALENAKFSTIAIPFYAILDPDEKVLATFPGLTRDPGEFLRFLGTRGPAPDASPHV